MASRISPVSNSSRLVNSLRRPAKAAANRFRSKGVRRTCRSSTREELRQVLRTPLLLNLFAAAFAGLRSELTNLDELETGEIRDAIFERFIRRCYEYERRKTGGELSM